MDKLIEMASKLIDRLGAKTFVAVIAAYAITVIAEQPLQAVPEAVWLRIAELAAVVVISVAFMFARLKEKGKTDAEKTTDRPTAVNANLN